MTKIDWNKPLQGEFAGMWYDINPDGTVEGYQSRPKFRNKPEPRYIWLNVSS